MNIETKFEERAVTIKYSLEEKEINILKKIKKIGYLEIRDSRREADAETLELYDLCVSLTDSGFIGPDLEAWHTTYLLTPLGKNFINSISDNN